MKLEATLSPGAVALDTVFRVIRLVQYGMDSIGNSVVITDPIKGKEVYWLQARNVRLGAHYGECYAVRGDGKQLIIWRDDQPKILYNTGIFKSWLLHRAIMLREGIWVEKGWL